ncbi:MAG: hypothetical protein JXB50_14135 [Spirochaetes bacterium]|nr:hypothetical protein [Spirochaetota bacterium]
MSKFTNFFKKRLKYILIPLIIITILFIIILIILNVLGIVPFIYMLN